MVRATISGLSQIERRFERLLANVEKSASRKSLLLAASPVVKAARQLAPKDSGALKRSMTKRAKTNKRRREVMVFVGPRRGAGHAGKNPSRYAHLVERGTKFARPTPFMAKAHAQADAQAREIYADSIGDYIEREAARLGNSSR